VQELQAIQIIGSLDRFEQDRERGTSKGSVKPARLQACSPVLSGSCPTPRPAQVILGGDFSACRHLQSSSCPGRSAKRVFALDVPGIHVFNRLDKEDVDRRGKPVHDDKSKRCNQPGR
jgi:hypothetical protein